MHLLQLVGVFFLDFLIFISVVDISNCIRVYGGLIKLNWS